MAARHRALPSAEEHSKGMAAEAASATMHGSLLGALVGGYLAVDGLVHGSRAVSPAGAAAHVAKRCVGGAGAVALLVGAFSGVRCATLAAAGPAPSLVRDGSAAFAGGAAAAAVYSRLPASALAGVPLGAVPPASVAPSVAAAARSSALFGLVCALLFLVGGVRGGLPLLPPANAR